MIFEVCTDNVRDAKIAARFKAKRIELCAALEVGGLTPSYGLIQQCAAITNIETHVIIRPRSGGFNYDKDELETMRGDVEASALLGAKGVVFGILDSSMNLSSANKTLLELAKNLKLEATFHRAFDLVSDPVESLEILIQLGFDRLLTSGLKPKAIEGVEQIKKLINQANGRIQIMAGSGVNASNAQELASCNIDALHFTARKPIPGNNDLNMGPEYEIDQDKIKNIMKQVC